jgi:hypothetical protein
MCGEPTAERCTLPDFGVRTTAETGRLEASEMTGAEPTCADEEEAKTVGRGALLLIMNSWLESPKRSFSPFLSCPTAGDSHKCIRKPGGMAIEEGRSWSSGVTDLCLRVRRDAFLSNHSSVLGSQVDHEHTAVTCAPCSLVRESERAQPRLLPLRREPSPEPRTCHVDLGVFSRERRMLHRNVSLHIPPDLHIASWAELPSCRAELGSAEERREQRLVRTVKMLFPCSATSWIVGSLVPFLCRSSSTVGMGEAVYYASIQASCGGARLPQCRFRPSRFL